MNADPSPPTCEVLTRIASLRDAINRISRQNMSTEESLAAMAKLGREMLNAESVSIFLNAADDPNTIVLHAGSCLGNPDNMFNGLRIPIHDHRTKGMTGFLAWKRELHNYNAEQLADHSCFSGRQPGHLPSRKCGSLLAALALNSDGRFLGLIKAENKLDTQGGVVGSDGFALGDEIVIQLLADKISLLLVSLGRDDEKRLLENSFKSLAEYLPVCLYRIDVTGRITYANPHFCKLHNRNLDQLLAKTVFDLFPRVLAEQYSMDDRTVLTGNIVERNEDHIANAQLMRVHVVKVPLYNSDGSRVIGIQGLFWDLIKDQNGHADLTRRMLDLSQRVQERTRELQLARDRFYGLVELNPDPILIHRDRVITYANAAAVRLVGGRDRSDLIGKNVIDFVAPAHRGPVEKRIMELLVTGAVQPLIEEQLLRLDGTAIDVEVTAALIPGLDGREVHLVVHDLTERKQKDKMTRAVVDNAPCLIFAKDANSKFTFVNKTLADHYGTTVDELLRQTDEQYCPVAKEVKQFRKDDLLVLSGAVPKLIIQRESVTSRSGEVHEYKTVKVPIRDYRGEIVQVLGISVEIDDLLRTKEKLKEAQGALIAQDGLQVLMDNVPDGIFFKDRQHRFVRANKALAGFFDVGSWEEIIGTTDKMFLEPELAQYSWDEEEKIFETGRPLINDVRSILTSRGLAYRLVTKVRSADGKFIIGISRDFSKLKKTEKQLYRAVLASTLFVHDVSANLDAIRDAVSNFDLHSAVREHGERVPTSSAAIALDRIITQINGAVEMRDSLPEIVQSKRSGLCECNLNEVIEEFVNGIRLEMPRFPIEWIPAKHSAPPAADVERQLLWRALSKLIENCRVRGNAKAVTVSLDDNEAFWIISVQDDGIGFPLDVTGEQFESPSGEVIAHGLGMGLAICSAVADLHRGKVAYENDPATNGAIARIFLPKPISKQTK